MGGPASGDSPPVGEAPPYPSGGPSGDRAEAGASKYLANLPSRGLFSSTVVSSNLGGIRVYICDRDTSPPEEQVIKTNTTNILIRALQINKQKSELKDANAKVAAESSKGKRSAVGALEGRTTKRANTSTHAGASRQGGSSTVQSEKVLQTLTVERLRALLRERGLSPKGRKDELIARLKKEDA